MDDLGKKYIKKEIVSERLEESLPDLNQKQLLAIELLASGATQKETYSTVGCGSTTLERWLKNPTFLLTLHKKSEDYQNVINAKLHCDTLEIISAINTQIKNCFENMDDTQAAKLRTLLAEFREYRKLLKLDFGEPTSIEQTDGESLGDSLQNVNSADKMQIINSLVTLVDASKNESKTD